MRKFYFLIAFFALTVSAIAQISVTGLNAPNYTANQGWVNVGTGVNISGSTAYDGGYMQIEVSNPTSDLGDQFQLVSSSSPNTLNQISISSGIVYLGNGSGVDVIGNVDATNNGQNGKPLKINFTSPFVNPSFEDGSLGWTEMEQWINLGSTSIAGFTSPNDGTYPGNTSSLYGRSNYTATYNDDAAPSSAYAWTVSTSTTTASTGSTSMQLYSNMTTAGGCDIVHGPAVYSSDFQASAGDVLYFDWRAYAGSDGYDVFGYLLNTSTGATTTVLDQTQYSSGGNTNWTTASVTVPSTGTYKFVFVNGTFDYSCGLAAGASLYIDNVRVYGNKVNNTVINNIAKALQYQHTCGSNTTTARTMKLTVQDGLNVSGNTTDAFTLTLPTPPSIVAPADITTTTDAATAASCTATNVALGTATASGGCSNTITENAPSAFGLGATTVVWTVTDSYGRTATDNQIVTVNPTAVPVLVAPADVTVNTDASSCTATGVSLGYPSITGSCYTISNNAPTVYPIGNTTVTWTMVHNGVTTTDDQIVTVVDNNQPWVSLQSGVTTSTNVAAINLDVSATSGATQNINGATIVVSNNFQSGDVLDIASTLPSGVTKSYNTTSGVLTLSGTMTPAQFETILQNVTFRTTSTVNNSVRTVSITAGQSISLNGHYYEYIPGTFTWAQAKSAAEGRTLNGLQGYLATITSQTENDFVRSKLSADAWVGGSDDYNYIYNPGTSTKTYSSQSAAEGKWYWVTGPESGQLISSGNGTPITASGMFANWNTNEPNNSGSNEHYMQFYSTGAAGRWNDLPSTSQLAYVVEYGGLSTDQTCLVFSDDILVTVNTLPQVTTNSAPTSVADVSAVIGGNVTNQGGSAVTERGIVFSTTTGPTTSNSKALAGTSTGVGTFSSTLSGLTANTTYYARAFATNSQGTEYGAEISFTTTPTAPAAITTDYDDATFGGSIICAGETATLTTSSTTAGTITWYEGGCGSGTALSTGATLAVTPSATTTYYARVENSTTGLNSTCESVTVTVQAAAPTIEYSGPYYLYYSSEAIAANSLTVSGSGAQAYVGSYSISPTLPAGLSFNTATGQITGTPTNGSPRTTYTVTGTTPCGSVSTTVELEILECSGLDVNDFTLRGNAATIVTGSATEFKLTDASNGQFGAVWNQTRLDLTKDFDIEAEVYLGNQNGADGIAFVLQPLSTNQGSTGGGLGYAGISPSFAVEFDTYQNGSESASDHIAFMENGNTTNHYGTYTTEMENNTWRSVRFKWEASTKTMRFYIDGNQQIVRNNYDMVANLFSNNPYVYWGFTGATGGLNNLQKVKFNRYCLTLAANTVANLTTTSPVISQTSTTASVEGTLVNDGGAPVTERGIVMGTSTAPTTANLKIANGTTGIGSYTEAFSSLTPSTLYYARSYAINSVGTGYGNEISFYTAPIDVALITSTDYDATAGYDVICYGASTTLTATTPDGVVQWYDDAAFTNLIGTGNTITVSPTSTTTYYARNLNNSLYSDNAASLTVTVRPQLVNPVIAGSETVCWNSRPNALTGVAATGGSSSADVAPGFSYQWEESIDGGTTWTAISGATNYATYQPGYLYQTTRYRLVAVDLGSPSCTSALISNEIEITVRDPFTPSVVSTNGTANTFCNAGAITLSATATTGGSGPAFFYQWQSSTDSLNWTNIGPLLNNTTTYTATGITTDTHFRIIAFDQGTPACGSVFSINTVKAVMQTPVTEGAISGAQHICAQTAPTNPIADVTAGTGRGTISYRWEESTDGGTTWTTISGATGASYQPGTLALTTKYRRYTISTLNGQSCESTSPTNEVEVTVDQLPIATMTTTSDVTCVNADYTLSGVNAQYGTVVWTHDGTGTLAGTSTLAPTYTPAATDAGNIVNITMTVTGTTICLSTQEAASLALQVDSLPKAVAGGSATICSNATHTVSGAVAKYGSIQWTHDGAGTLTDATTLTPTYAPTAADAGNTVTLTMTVTSTNQCAGESDQATYTIDVDPLPVATAGGSDIICSLASATVSGATAANGTILWTSNGSGTIADATTLTPTYTAGASDAGSTITMTMTVTSDNTCTPQTATATYDITVRPDFIPATFALSEDQDLCYLTSASTITATAANGGTGPYSYQWQESNDSITWTNISGATSLTYTPVGILNATKYYRILSTDDGTPGCGTTLGGARDIKVLVRNPLTPPVVSNITLCNSTSATIVPIGARGGRGTFEYQWQESANGSTGWANVGVSSLDSTFTTPSLSATTYYRVIARDKDQGSLLSCGSTFSSAMKVTVGVPATAGAISGDETICIGSTATTIASVTAGTGSGSISYTWEESTDAGTTWSVIAGATSETYSPGAIAQTTSYRRTTVATLNGTPCSSATTNVVTITVDQLPTYTAAPSNMLVSTDAGLPTAVVSYVATATGPTAVTLTYAITGATTASGSGTGSGEAFGIGTSTVTITATTNCGATTTSFDVVVEDNENPVITAGADESHNTSVATTGCAMPLTITSPVATDNAPGVAVTYVLSGATTGTGTSISAVSFNVGTTTITWTATDASGNTATATQDITVTDAVAPAIAGMPSDITVNAAAGLCTEVVTWTAPTSSDECGIASFTSDASSGDAFAVGTTTVTYTATDNNGNVTTGSFDVTVVDAQLPIFASVPADQALTSDANTCGTTATWTAPTTSDNCGIASVTSTHSSGDFFAVGTTTVTYTATDVNGNVETASFDIVVGDLNPVIAGVPSDITVSNDAGDCSAVATWTAPTVTDNCAGVTMISTHASGDVFAVGTTTVTYTATDNNGNITTASFDVTVNDTEAPVFVSAPSDITVSTTATTCDAAVTWTEPVVSDNCTSAPTVTSTHASGDVFAKGTTTVTYTVVDADGNTTTTSFDVTVEDNTAPIIAAVTDITVDVDAASCSSASPGVVTPLATDNCDAIVTVTGVRSDSQALTDAYPLGTTTITWSASDAAGNAATSLVQTIEVIDTIAPYVSTQLPSIVYLEENTCTFYLEAWRDSVEFSDNCGGSATLTSARPANLFLNKGTHTITYTLTDVDGNARVYNHLIEVVDTISPILLNMPADITIAASATSCGTVVSWTPPTPSDNCVSFVMNGTAKSGDYFPLGTTTVTYTLTDAAGLTVVDAFDITVVDQTAPTIDATNLVVSLDASGAATITLADVLGADGIIDNCTVSSSSIDVSSFGCADLGANNVVITAVDASGNTTTETVVVTVEDHIAPAVVAQNATVYLDASGSASIVVADVHDNSSDNCGVASTTINVSSFDCTNVGTNSVVVSSTDASGNVGTATATVTVVDTISPSLTVPSTALVAYASSSCSATVNYTGVVTADNCATPVVTYDVASGSVFNVGTTTVTATSTDASGNTTVASFDVTVLDTVSPVIDGKNLVVSLDASGSASITLADVLGANGITDNCTLASSSIDVSSFGCSDLGVNNVVITAVDASGNTTTETVVVTVEDNIAPAVVAQNATVYLDASGSATIAVGDVHDSSSDNCGVATTTIDVSSFDCTNVGTNSVVVSATDASGNVGTATATVTVVDTISPSLTVPTTALVAYASSSCSATVNYTGVVTADNCGTPVVTYDVASGSVFNVGTTTVTATSTDASGNTTVASFDVTVLDTVSPTLANVPVTANITPDPTACGATVTWVSPNAMDNCSATVSASATSGGYFGVGTHTVVFTATDASGNTTTDELIFTVSDVIDPVFASVQADTTVYASANMCEAVVNWLPMTATDNCSTPTVVTSVASGSSFGIGTTTVMVTASDTSGNSVSTSFDVTVLDTVAPTWVYVPMDTTMGSCNSAVTYAMPAASDNCLGVTVVQTAGLPSGSVFPVGTTTNTFVATDASGNATTSSFDVTILGSNVTYTQSIFDVCPGDGPVDLADPAYAFTFSGVNMSGSMFDPTELNQGVYTITYSYVDSMGCASTGTFNVLVNAMPVQPSIIRLSSTNLTINNNYPSYQWRKNGNNIPGATKQTYVVTSAGVYDCVVGNGTCTIASDTYAFGNVGIDEVEAGTFLVYPNPSQGRLKIVHGFGNEALSVQVVNLLGQTIYQDVATNSVIELDLSDKAQGSYILILRNSETEVHQPIKIQR